MSGRTVAPTSRLPGLFAEAGEIAAEQGVLDEAVARLAETVAPETLADALCRGLPDGYGWCAGCGAKLKGSPHKRGGNGCLTGFVTIPAAAARALVRRAISRLPARSQR